MAVRNLEQSPCAFTKVLEPLKFEPGVGWIVPQSSVDHTESGGKGLSLDLALVLGIFRMTARASASDSTFKPEMSVRARARTASR